MPDTIHIIVLDDRRLLREALVMVLQAMRGKIDTREAVDLDTALEQAGTLGSRTVVLMNSHSEEEDLKLIAGLHEAAPGVATVLITATDSPWFIARAMQKGARGVVPASSGGAEVFHILRLIAAGGTYAPASVLLTAYPVDGPTFRPARESDADEFLKLFPELSRKQVNVLSLIARGRSNREIADDIQMRENAVKAQVHQIMRKLGLRNRTEAALLTNQRLYGVSDN